MTAEQKEIKIDLDDLQKSFELLNIKEQIKYGNEYVCPCEQNISLQECIDKVKTKHPLWKSASQIIGRAGEMYCYINMKCMICFSSDWLKCAINEKAKDQICDKCNKNYQIKCKKITKKQYKKIKNEMKFKTLGAQYRTTLESLKENIDYIIILYNEQNIVLGVLHIKSSDITSENIIPRKKLGKTAKRAGWQGCNLHFDKFTYIFDTSDE